MSQARVSPRGSHKGTYKDRRDDEEKGVFLFIRELKADG